jgi:hypothetical protein
MAELAPGEKSWMKMKKPPAGYFTVKAVANHLRLNTPTILRHCKALGIEVGPFVRDEPCVKKVYKNMYRWLTEEEAARVIERVAAFRGARDGD